MTTRSLLSLVTLVVIFSACRSDTGKDDVPPQEETYFDYAYGSEEIEPGLIEEYPVITDKRASRNPRAALVKLFSKLQKPSQTFTIEASETSKITGDEGTAVSFGANVLVYKGTQEAVDGAVQIVMREFYNTADILKADLTTTSNGEMLETGGMIQIKAFSGGRECELAKGAFIDIDFPVRDGFRPGMQAFYGDWSSGDIDWIPATGETVISGEPDSLANEKPLMLSTASEEDLWPNIAEASRYPYSSLVSKKEGTVYVSFEIDKDARPVKAMVELSSGPGLDKAAHYIVANIPRWAPADTIPNAQDFRYIVPIHFSLPKNLTSADYEKARAFQQALNDSEIVYSERSRATVGTRRTTDIATWAARNNARIVPRGLSSYLISSGQLGWINCDRWRRLNRRKRTDFVVGLPASWGADVKIVFHNENAYLSGRQSDNRVLFSAVPANEPITVVALIAVGDKAYLAIGETHTSMKGLQLEFEQMTVEQVAARLALLNGA